VILLISSFSMSLFFISLLLPNLVALSIIKVSKCYIIVSMSIFLTVSV
jgi:hypothetical protein